MVSPKENPRNNMDMKKLKATVLYSVLYISLILFSNLGSLRVILLAGLSLDGGTLLYPFTFTMRDVLHKKCGGDIARFVILLSAAINLLMFAFAALGPATGNFDLIFLIGMFGELFMVLFFLLYGKTAAK